MAGENGGKQTGLRIPSRAYKPFRYPWAYDFWRRQQQVHWMPEEVPLGEDVKDWASKLSDEERNLLTQIFRFFTQSDIEVNDNYMERYARVFKPTEVKMMLSAFSNIETIHIAAYALLLETIGMPDSEFAAFLDYQQMRDKHDYMHKFGVETDADILRTLAMFGAFTEGLQLFASFAMLMNFPRFNKMKGMGQIVTWSVRDESLHCEGMIKLFHAYAKETGALTDAVKNDIVECCKTVVGMEDRFIELAQRLMSLNPNDNHFMRAPLTRAYLAEGAAEKVIALTDRFPDDFCGPTLNRLLALLRLGQRGDALALLHDCSRDHGTAIKMLLATDPKAPRSSRDFGVRVGSKEEAWEYRTEHFSLWQQDGALDWLREVWHAVGNSRRK